MKKGLLVLCVAACMLVACGTSDDQPITYQTNVTDQNGDAGTLEIKDGERPVETGTVYDVNDLGEIDLTPGTDGVTAGITSQINDSLK